MTKGNKGKKKQDYKDLIENNTETQAANIDAGLTIVVPDTYPVCRKKCIIT